MIAEPKTECKVSLVRQAIEAALASRRSGPPLKASREVERLLCAAWLSLPKCLVCGAEEDLVSSWVLDTSSGEPVREPVCVSCRNHPSIRPFEEF